MVGLEFERTARGGPVGRTTRRVMTVRSARGVDLMASKNYPLCPLRLRGENLPVAPLSLSRLALS
jgi:hypothetical protein